MVLKPWTLKKKSNISSSDEFAFLLPFSPKHEGIEKLPFPQIRQFDFNPYHPELVNNVLKPKEEINKPWETGFEISYWEDLGRVSFGLADAMPVQSTDMAPGNYNVIDQSSDFGLENYTSAPILQEAWVHKNLNLSGFVGKYFSKRWAWRVGLDFSRSSYFSDYLNANPIESATTSITSIGIPISLKLDVIQRDRFNFRTGFAFVNEVPIFESVKADYGVAALAESVKQFNVGYMGALKFDLTTEFRIGPRAYLALSPSYKYYFTQRIGSQNLLIRKDHWLGGSIGLTWKL